MYFHEKCGSLIEFSSDRQRATRTDSFCNGITFSAVPIPVGDKISIEFTENVSGWSGAVRFGFTSIEPSEVGELPKYAVPDLTNKPGFWAKALSENEASKGYQLTYYVDEDGNVHYYINNEYKGVHINKVEVAKDKSLWAMIDIYGQTKEIKFVDPESAPTEILARGPESMKAFLQASKAGTKPIFRTRLMLVGQDRVGKTSLKKSLTGQRYNSSEESTDGIDTSAACEINIEKFEAWQIHKNVQEDENGVVKGVLDGSEGLEEEYTRAIANNIVQDLLSKKRKEKNKIDRVEKDEKLKVQEMNEKNRQEVVDTDSNKSESISDSIQNSEDEVIADNDLLKDMPEKIVTLVTQLLNEAESKNMKDDDVGKSTNKNIVLNIWDFAGQAVYYTTHQVFLTSRAIYIIVFNLSHDLDAPAHTQVRSGDGKIIYEDSELTNLDFMDFWMSSIHAHTAENQRSSPDNMTLSPPIFIVGTHRNTLNSDDKIRKQIIEEKFHRIRENLKGKPYCMHVVNRYYAVENNMENGEDEEVCKLRKHVEEVASGEPYMAEQMPIKWLKFEQKVSEYIEHNTFYLSLNQIVELGKELDIKNHEGLTTMLQFYHDLGVIIYYGGSGAVDESLQNTVILKPQWLVDVFKRVITVKDIDKQWPTFIDSWTKLDQAGILEDRLINHMWRDVLEQKNTLLGLMEKFDLLCERIPPKYLSSGESSNVQKSYYVPSRLRDHPNKEELTTQKTDVIFYITFGGFLPDGLFHRILTRAVRWSQEQGGHEPKLYHRMARFYLDEDHDFAVEMAAARFARIKVSVMRVESIGEDDEIDDAKDQPPNPDACAKVRHFLDSTLADLRAMWMKRVKYEFSVQCPCGSKKELHFLNLDQCLNNKMVLCDHRRIKTAAFKKWFPSKSMQIVPPPPINAHLDGNIRMLEEELPAWMKGVAKLLNAGSEGSDWLALAEKLGYKKAKVQKFADEVNPALEMITDWIYSSGNTTLSIDLMLTCLEQMHREDVIDIIQKGQESSVAPPSVFISYNWGIQDEVKRLRDRLEKNGFQCWMDIGQMGGGDTLYERIDEGIRNCKVVIACITPKYIVSHNCNREVSLADLLKKPIIPVMFQKVTWPPPGGMSLVFSQLLYVQMKGIGGHGGAGVHADLEAKYTEIIDQITRYVQPQSPKEVLPSQPSDPISSQQQIQQQQQVPQQQQSQIVSSLQSSVYQSSPSIPNTRTTATTAVSHSEQQPNPVEQVAVTRCTVCTLL
ncbi:uncharacterized protein [Ptychodera flava]|uniref:uncharacterized protein n=1 Tax=Ptychodera flava TaxID=63121 RepID=UPI003969BC1A